MMYKLYVYLDCYTAKGKQQFQSKCYFSQLCEDFVTMFLLHSLSQYFVIYDSTHKDLNVNILLAKQLHLCFLK